jgi:polyribonucleotide nucleotidyltransferase
MYEAIMKAHEAIKPLVDFIQSIKDAIGKPKFAYPSCEIDHAMFDKIEAMVGEEVKLALDTDDKKVRDARLQPLYDRIYEALAEEYPDSTPQINECMYKLQKKIVRHWLKEERRRVDGRKMDQIRPLAAEVGILPRTHGSALFTRGQTQVLTVATLAPLREAQLLDGIDAEETKRYMHHYNMPAYSVGEAKASRSPGRREIGHGALAERALEPVIPLQEDFPYAIRLVSEVVSSNGSTSQASVCGSTLALMDAGVPISSPVAGISCGLITDDDGGWATMIDIQGLEDFFGDMDFKVAGTKKGITAIQMDLKIDGLTPEIIKNALEVTKKGRFNLIDNVMLPCITEPRHDVSEYAPKMISTKIDPEKIREVIGSGGKVIQKICADTGAQIDIEDDGSIFISAIDKKNAYKALDIINAIVMDPEPGAIYTGKVTGIIPIGCFVEYAPGKEGLVHISKLDKKRVEKVEDVVAIGDTIKVMVLGVDNKGRINLSRKDALDVFE